MNRLIWIVLTGVLWFVIGIYLLTLGFYFIIAKAQLQPHETDSLIAYLQSLTGNREQAALLLITIGLFLGFFKARYVLFKTVRSIVDHIIHLPSPYQWFQIYPKKYPLLIGGMVLLGMSLKWLKLPLEIRGCIDVAIGSALVHGAMLYFRLAWATRKKIAP